MKSNLQQFNADNMVGKLLVASPSNTLLPHDVRLIIHQNSFGAMGFSFSKRFLKITLKDLMEKMRLSPTKSISEYIVYQGGDLDQEQGFVLHSCETLYEKSMKINNQLALTLQTNLMRDIAEGKLPKYFWVFLGFTGWTNQELADDIKDPAWIVMDFDRDLVFKCAIENLWTSLLINSGYELSSLSHISSSSLH